MMGIGMIRSQFPQTITLVGVLLTTLDPANAQDWTRFRGPNGTGVSEAKTIPAQWTEKNIRWKIELPGPGHSSPVIWEDRLFATSAAQTTQLIVFCLNTKDGSAVWRREFPLAPYRLHRFNTAASSTPAVGEHGLYLVLSSPSGYKLIALSHRGEDLWQHDLGSFASQHGAGGSPIVVGDMVVVAKDQDGESFIAALDARKGDPRWQTAVQSLEADYGTPCVDQSRPGKPLLIFNSSEDGVLALDLQTGAKAWQMPKVFNQRCVSSPLLAGGLVIGSCGSGGGGNYVAAVRPPRRDGDQPEIAYTIRRSAPYVPTSLALGDLLFLWSDGGVVTCLDASSGTQHWQERVGGNFFASPICIDRRLLGVSTAGEVVIIEASKRFRELGRYALNETTHATPAVSGERLFVRTLRHLLCVGE